MARDKKTTDTSAVILSDIQDKGLTKPLIMSVIIHVILIGVFSIGYIGLCVKHKTLDPKAEISRIADEKVEAEHQNKKESLAAEVKKEENDGPKKQKQFKS